MTTHWERCDVLAAQYPDIIVDPDPIFIKDGDLATSAGVTAGIDLALALVEDDLGRDAALAVARQLVVFLRRPGSQSQFSAQLSAQLAERRPLREVQQWIAEHPAADLSVETLADGRACRPGSSPARSRPRPGCHPAGTWTWPGWRPPGGTWRTPPPGSSRPPAPAATAPPRRCAVPSSGPSASARPSTAADSARQRRALTISADNQP